MAEGAMLVLVLFETTLCAEEKLFWRTSCIALAISMVIRDDKELLKTLCGITSDLTFMSEELHFRASHFQIWNLRN